MSTLLHLDASASLQTSISRQLSAEFVRQWVTRNPNGKVIRRDLAIADIKPIDQEWIGAAFTPLQMRSAAQRGILTVSDALVRELKDSEEIVLGTSMYNFATPAALKLWIDQIVRVDETYAYVEGTRKGLLSGKRAHVFIASGGTYPAGSPAASFDFLSPYLRAIFGYMGIEDLSEYCAGGTQALLKPNADRDAFIESHLAKVREMQ